MTVTIGMYITLWNLLNEQSQIPVRIQCNECKVGNNDRSKEKGHKPNEIDVNLGTVIIERLFKGHTITNSL